MKTTAKITSKELHPWLNNLCFLKSNISLITTAATTITFVHDSQISDTWNGNVYARIVCFQKVCITFYFIIRYYYKSKNQTQMLVLVHTLLKYFFPPKDLECDFDWHYAHLASFPVPWAHIFLIHFLFSKISPNLLLPGNPDEAAQSPLLIHQQSRGCGNEQAAVSQYSELPN